MKVPADRFYSPSHEWLLLEGETGVVGVTDHAQRQLSDIVFVELPEVGRHVRRGEAVATIESVKAASDVYAPLTGEIRAVNDDLVREPGWINTDPYGKGWLFRIHVEDRAETEQLQSAEAYEAHTAGEAQAP